MHGIKWFYERVGKTVLKDNVEVTITSKEEADQFYFEQKDFTTFNDIGEAIITKPRVHDFSNSACVACEG